jgi:hypothetical protein
MHGTGLKRRGTRESSKMTRMRRAVPPALIAIALATTPGCKGSKHARVTPFVAPVLPAGFVAESGVGWSVAVPSTWKEASQKGSAAWAVADPQAVDDFQASVNVLTESFAGESFDYAKASEAALRSDPHATVEASRDDVIDGDPTLILESRWSPAPPSTAAYRTMQTALASRGTGYVLTCAASASAFERYRSTCESIVRSFAVQR